MRIVYIAHVDWDWIKQRPHFIAEGLSENHEVSVFYQKRYNRKGFQKNRNDSSLNIRPIRVIPRGNRYAILNHINSWIKKTIINCYSKKHQSDYWYVTFPDQVDLLGDYNGKLIYDCMDNYPAFEKFNEKQRKLIDQERCLVERATQIICSSQKLKDILVERYGVANLEKITVVRNGYAGKLLPKSKNDHENNKFVLTYFGTISGWFNFDFLLRSLKEVPNIEYRLFGPIDNVEIPKVDGIRYMGTAQHDELKRVAEESDCLMMPFWVTEIVESVDPVKLYEYINFDRDILCVKYKEIERFESFVYFYEGYEEFRLQLQRIIDRNEIKYTDQERVNFLENNSWQCRVAQINEILSK